MNFMKFTVITGNGMDLLLRKTHEGTYHGMMHADAGATIPKTDMYVYRNKTGNMQRRVVKVLLPFSEWQRATPEAFSLRIGAVRYL